MDCSIVMISQATYPKRLHLLEYSLMTLRQNTLYPFELIVVDNGQKEHTEFLKTQKINKHIINNKNLGMGTARNQGADASDSEFIAFVDNDLVYRKGWLKNSIGLLKRYYQKIIAPVFTIPMKNRQNWIGELDGYSLWSLAASMCLVFKRTDFEKIGYWDGDPHEDRDYANRVIKMGYSYMLLNPPRVRHIGRTSTWKGKNVRP